MSGGSLNYFYTMLNEHAGDFGDKELDALVSDLAELFKDREWYLSGDTGRGDWAEAMFNFKQKWFTQHGRQQRIEEYLQQFTDEIRESLGINHEYCINCKHWIPKEDSVYGRCEHEPRCLMHKYDRCKDFEGYEVMG